LQDGGESSLVSEKSIFNILEDFFFKMADKFRNGMIQIANPVRFREKEKLTK
jgi:hypothetical protein